MNRRTGKDRNSIFHGMHRDGRRRRTINQGREPAGSHDWPIYGGTPDNNHFSPLSQINRKNVKQLKIAWTFDTEESGGLQTSPIDVDGVLYGLTPYAKSLCAECSYRKLLWKFDSGIKGTQPDRGLAYWSDGKRYAAFWSES